MIPVIRVENVSKQYRIGTRRVRYSTLRDTLADVVRSPAKLWQRNGNKTETIWALRDVSFDVQAGEVVGIIGGNGAGKSTLLKILSRITEPTTGRVELYGRIGSLLEVGTGFHLELTGRENIYLNGAILGMKRAEIERQFDNIVGFSEVGKFIDTPVKHYSSGMYMRLAFAVASHLEPEILVVDEVLAVGDASFQKKCLGKMGKVASEGRTVLFVSHNMTAMQGLCSRVIWLREGRVMADGETSSVISEYLNTSFSSMAERVWDDVDSAPGGDTVRLHRASVRPLDGTPADPITVKTPYVLEFEYWNLKPETVLNLSIVLLNEEGMVLFNTGSGNDPAWEGRPHPAGLFRSVCQVPGDLMNDGPIRVRLHIVKDHSSVISTHEEVLSFEVREAHETRRNWYGKWVGAVRPNLTWQTELLDESESTARAL